MALFGKKTKSLEDILKEIEALSDEDKAKLIEEVNKPQEVVPKADDEPKDNVDTKTEEGANPAEKPAEENAENATPTEPTEEGKPVEEGAPAQNTEATPPVVDENTPTEPTEPTEPTAPTEPVVDAKYEEQFKSLADRIAGLEAKIGEYDQKIKAYDDYVAKKMDSLGATPKADGGEKDIHEMTADELAKHIQKGI